MKPTSTEIQPQYIIDQNGKTTAVILDIDTFKTILEKLEDQYFGELAQSILESDKEKHSLDQIKQEIGARKVT